MLHGEYPYINTSKEEKKEYQLTHINFHWLFQEPTEVNWRRAISRRSPGEGNGNPLQYSCLENPIDRGAWWATVLGVTKSQMRLSTLTHTMTGKPR